MSRKPRLHAPGAIYHVILRGNAGQDVFNDDKDRYRFYDIIRKSCERFQHRILSFCLMTNHIHLLVQVGEIPLSRIMQNLSQRYTQWFNWRNKKTGHVFQGRYKAVMVDAETYLLELVAYIHLNPVRAHLTDRPEDHRWSSYRVYLGKENLCWVETGKILSYFSDKLKKARSMFDEYLGERITEGRRKEYYGANSIDSRILGDDNFVETVLSQVESIPTRRPDVQTVIEAVKRVYGKLMIFSGIEGRNGWLQKRGDLLLGQLSNSAMER